MARTKKKLGDILVEMGAIDPLQLQSALGYANQWGMPLGRAVVDRNFCSRDDVLRALSLQTGHPVIRLDGHPMDKKMAGVVPVKLAEELRVVPLKLGGKRGEVLELAVAAPGDLGTVDRVLQASGKRSAVVHLAHDEEVERALGRLYHGKADVAPAVQPLARSVAVQSENVFELEEAEGLLETPDEAPGPRPVRLFGWHQASMRALKAMIERGGVQAEPLAEGDVSTLSGDDVLIASTLALVTELPVGHRVPAKLIICGAPEDSDIADARALGAKVYLRPPFSTEQLVAAVKRVS